MNEPISISTKEALVKARLGFQSLNLNADYTDNAMRFLNDWLEKDDFTEYRDQILHLIEKQDWDYLLDCFYKVIPFGTGGRRGEVGLGPNRINEWTIRSSAQGHSQYLLKLYGDEAKERGIVFTYDVRIFLGNAHLSTELPNPLIGLDGKRLSEAAADVYAANGIKIFMFDGIRTTPELSFAIRHLHAISGDMFSASHNPPDHNGKKVFDETGGQLIPPHDQNLVDEVTKNVQEIKRMDFQEGIQKGLISYLDSSVDDAYIDAVSKLTYSDARDIKIVYTPMHGCGRTSVECVLQKVGFHVDVEPMTSNPSGKFENITFNIPNPEVEESFEIPLRHAKEAQADILVNSDPDADRIGIMIDHHGEWKVINGNEIGIILTEYAVTKAKERLQKKPLVIKTMVTTNLVSKICEENNVEITSDLLVGFKYIGDEMNKLEDKGEIDRFIFSCEESHGYLAGNYARDKDAAVAAIWLCELAAELKKDNKTLLDYLNDIYTHYEYYRNYLTEVRLLGAVGLEKIRKIQDSLRNNPIHELNGYTVTAVEDMQDHKPILSETDFVSKDMLVFKIAPYDKITSAVVTIRPSGTEPKIKMYFELSCRVENAEKLESVKEYVESELRKLERAVMNYCYSIIGVDFPERGFLLFWQLPLDDKLHYFEIEDELAALKDASRDEIRTKVSELLAFLGSDPIEKVSKAFEAKYHASLNDYLGL